MVRALTQNSNGVWIGSGLGTTDFDHVLANFSIIDALIAAIGGRVFDVSKAPYNCAVDGTTDDTTGFAAALTAANAAGGGIVFVPKGTGLLVITSAQTIPANVSVRSVPGGGIKRTSASTAFVMSANSGFQGIILDGGSVASQYMITVAVDDVSIEQVKFQNCGSYDNGVIRQTAGARLWIVDNKFLAIPNCSISINTTGGGTISAVTIHGNYIEQTTADKTAISYIGYNAATPIPGAHITNNVIYSKGPGIYTTNGGFADSTIANNVVYRTATSWTYGYALFGMIRSSFTGNVFNDQGYDHSSYAGFAILDTYDSTITGNVAYQTATTSVYGFTFLDSARNTLSNNFGYGGGINLTISAPSGSDSDNVISGNVIQFRNNATSVAGILISATTTSGTASRNIITGNRILGQGTNTSCIGISLAQGSGSATDSNYLADNFISGLPTGISIGSGVTGTVVESHHFTTVTTPVSDSGTGSNIVTHIVAGTGSLASGTPSTLTVTLSGNQVFTADHYQVVVSNVTNHANPIGVTLTDGTSITFTGPDSVTDTISYIIMGY
jgi:hypothetical protein